MKIKSLNVSMSQNLFDKWDKTSNIILDLEYRTIREELLTLYSNNVCEEGTLSKYQIDLSFGIALKEYFENKPWFNLRVAADIGFWRFLSVCVIPDIVAKRWPDLNEDHFWKKPARIWLRSIWWFVFLGWTEDKSTTLRLLSRFMFDTDVILNTVERTGRKGTHIKLYNTILNVYASIPETLFKSFGKGKKSETLFRSVMKLNTAEILTMEPELCEGGVNGYVKGLFNSVGLSI